MHIVLIVLFFQLLTFIHSLREFGILKWNSHPYLLYNKILCGQLQIFTDPPRLFIKRVQKEDQGMYQCFVTNEWEQIQSTAELQLGGN